MTLLWDAGYSPVLDDLPAAGLILDQPDYHRLGIWIMPNNTDPGMIEDFYLRAIPQEDEKLRISRDFVAFVPSLKIAKSTYRVWLAIQADPVGPAIALNVGQVSREAGEIPAFIQLLSKLIKAPESL